MILPAPPLVLLARLKLKGALRQQKRRLKRPSSLAFALLGMLMFGLWMTSLVIGRSLGSRMGGPVDLAEHRLLVQAGCLAITLLTVLGALNHRGLYLPREEIERLFASPVRRSDLVRYRLLTSTGRAIFGGVVFGLLALGRLPHPVFGFIGILVGMFTVPVLGQAVSLLAGDAENRLGRVLVKRRLKLSSVLLGIVLWLVVMVLFFGDALSEMLHIDLASAREQGTAILETPVVKVVLAPFRPWALLVTSGTLTEFTGWLAVCLAIWVVLFECCVRLPIDFRELSLDTSADVARRIRRVRSGGFGASAGKVSARAAGRQIPWLFGRGPFGAIAWLKLASILRKARGTTAVSLGIVTVLTVAFTVSFQGHDPASVVGGAGLIALIGAVYLCAGLRFDFRMDFERMQSVKAWPLRPTLVFLATLLPEVMLVSVLLIGAITVRAAYTRTFHPGLAAIAATLPLFTLIWVSIDNALYLLAPVRYVPGQEGALHHAGRSVVLLLMRMTALAVVMFSALGSGMGIALVLENVAGLDVDSARAAGFTVGWTVLLVLTSGLVVFGGLCLKRFDVARDRG